MRTGTQTKHHPGGRSLYRGRGRGAAYYCFLIEPRRPSPGMEPPSMCWPLPHGALNEKMLYSWIGWRHLLNRGQFLSDDSCLCQVDTQNTQKISTCTLEVYTNISSFSNSGNNIPKGGWICDSHVQTVTTSVPTKVGSWEKLPDHQPMTNQSDTEYGEMRVSHLKVNLE